MPVTFATLTARDRDWGLDEAELELERMRAEVTAWPADAARDEQLDDLAHLLDAVGRRDAAMAQKRAHSLHYVTERGYSERARARMGAQEVAWTDAYKVAQGDPAGPRHGPAAFTLPRPDGGQVRIEVVVGDLTDEAVDAIVNPSNRGLFGTAGIDGAVHRRGGPELTAACRGIGGIKYAQAVVTPGFRLPADQVIHTTTIPWKGGAFGELETLAAAYGSSFDVARRLRLRSLALPAIGTGAYGYPLEAATEVAVRVALGALRQPGRLELVRFVLFEPGLAELYRRVLAQAVAAATP